MENIKYSFVLPAYKTRFFKEAIDSILAQTYTDFELIIVNDASPGDMDSIVKSYNDPRIRYYINEQNIGGKDLVAQWNRCLEYAKGEYVILASDDDVYSSLYLEKMDELVCKYPEVNIFRPLTQLVDGNDVVIRSFNTKHVLDKECECMTQVKYLYILMRGLIGSGIAHYVFRRTELMRIGGFFKLPSAWGSDDVTAVTMAENGIAVYPEVLFSFRSSGINITCRKSSVKDLHDKLSSYKIYEKWLEKTIDSLGVVCDIDEQYYKYVKENYKKRYIRGLLVEVLFGSSFKAVMCNLKLFYSLKSVDFIWGTYWIARFILRELKQN